MANSRVWRWIINHKILLILLAGIGAAMALRASLLDMKTDDYRHYLKPWYDFILNNGQVLALQHSFYDYTPSYVYLLTIASYLLAGISKVVAIKSISIVFDCVCAIFVYKIVRIKYPRGAAPHFAFLATLLAPTVIVNSSAWGQSDSIYTATFLACAYFLITGRQSAAFVAWGLAFALKPQAIFLLPMMLVLWTRGFVTWRRFLIVPVTFGLSLLPVVLMGRPVADVFNTLFTEGEEFRWLSGNAPNLYLWLPNKQFDLIYPIGLIGAVVIVAVFVFWIYRRKLPITPSTLVQLATLSVLIMPFILPKMHERYFFPADVFSIVLAFYFPRYFFAPIVVGAASLLSYAPYFFQDSLFPLKYLAVPMLVVIALLLRHLAMARSDEASRAPSG